jgi:protein-S-isoprenylcysteine O-methyltransferase Ste14
MYVSVLLAIAGWSLLFGSVTILVYGIVVFAAFHAFVVLYEEPKLTSLFGDEYTAYCARVRRWGVGRPSPQ